MSKNKFEILGATQRGCHDGLPDIKNMMIIGKLDNRVKRQAREVGKLMKTPTLK